MELDLENLERHIVAGTLRKVSWGYGHGRACLMSALVESLKTKRGADK